MNNRSMQHSSDSKLISDLSTTINGEYTAIYCYEQLANQTSDDKIKKRILDIRNDEIRHFQTFSNLFMTLTGQHPTPQVTKQCSTDYRQGILDAFIDEQETVDFYHAVARSTNNPVVKNAFTQASADEQNHAVWYLFFMNHY